MGGIKLAPIISLTEQSVASKRRRRRSGERSSHVESARLLSGGGHQSSGDDGHCLLSYGDGTNTKNEGSARPCSGARV
jgi:hypothetical protein